MYNSFLKSIILTFIFVSSLFSSNEELNQKLFELKTSQEYAQKINDEKITLIMGQIMLKENEIKELENKLDELRKDKNSLENYKNIIDRQDKRIEDVHSNLNYWGIGFSLIAILTGLVVFLVNRSYANSAKKEAKLAAEKELRKWIDEKADEEFKSKVDVYLEEIDERAKKLFERNEGLTQKLEDRIKSIYEKDYTEDEKKELEEEVQEIKSSKSESDYTFEDKYKLFVSKYVNNEIEKEDALKILKTIKEDKLSDKNLSTILMTEAFILSELGETKKSIEKYDKIIDKYGNKKEYDYIVANVKYRKANVNYDQYRNKDNYIDILRMFDEIIDEYKNHNDSEVLKHVVDSYCCKFCLFNEFTDITDKKEKEIIEYLLEIKNRKNIDEDLKSYIKYSIDYIKQKYCD
ncbi:hypothetical protein ACOJTA_13615 [Malaciobacter sp. WC5094]